MMQSSNIRLVVPYGLKSLLEGVSRAAMQNNPDDIAEFLALYFQDLVTFRKGNPNLDITELVEKFELVNGNGNERLEEKTLEYTDTLFSREPKQRDKCTDTEEDQLLEEPDIQYSSRVTQYPSVASSIVESKFPPGSDGASSPEGSELVYVPAEPAQLAAHVLDQTAYLLRIELPLNAGQGSSATALDASAGDLVCHPERAEPTAEVESTEQVYVLSAMASSEAGQPPPHSNVWTLYCLTDLRQGQKSSPSLSPAGAGIPYSQATLSLSRGKDQHCGQLSQVSTPIYMIQEASKRRDAPPFILVGSNVQNAQDWKPIPRHAVFAQQEADARRRFATVPVPVARPADEPTDMASPKSNSAEETAAQPCTPDTILVAIPLDDVMSAKKGSPAGDKHPG